jgi:antirestriction protein ArdC
VRKGERSLPCVFWTEWEVIDKQTGEPETIPVIRYYAVFNSDQCEGISHKRLAELQAPTGQTPFEPIMEAQSVVDGMPKRPALVHEGARAFYRPSTDTVTMPPTGLFERREDYYSTLFHELGHSTGHQSRLSRKGIAETTHFGSYVYGQEELVAEMASAFLCGHCHIDPTVIDNQAAYLDAWIRTIKSDRKLVVVAAAQAQKAADFILNNGGGQQPPPNPLPVKLYRDPDGQTGREVLSEDLYNHALGETCAHVTLEYADGGRGRWTIDHLEPIHGKGVQRHEAAL